MQNTELLHKRFRGASAVLLIAGLSLAFPLKAGAQSIQGAAINAFHTAPAGSDWFTLDSLDYRGTLQPVVRLLVDQSHNPLIVYNPNNTQRTTAVKNQTWLNLGGSMTFRHLIRFSLNVPIAAYQNSEPSTFNGMRVDPQTGGGIGDITLSADARAFGAYGDPLTLGGGVTVGLPTGSQQDLLGDGRTSVVPHLSAAGTIGRYQYAGQIGYAFRSGNIAIVNFNNEFRYAAAGGIRFLNNRLLVGPELYGAVDTGSSAGQNRGASLEGDVGGHYRISPEWKISAGAGGGIVRSPGVPEFRLLASVEWSPLPKAHAAAAPAFKSTPRAVPPAPLAKVKDDRIVIFETILFEKNKSVISPQSFPTLEAVADILKTEPKIQRVSIEGHTDLWGNKDYNQQLSERRAGSVKTWLIQHGVLGNRLESHGFGSSKPLTSNKTRQGSAQNRRVEFRIVQ